MASKKQHEAFNKNVHKMLIGMGATQSGKWQYKYTLETKAGPLYLTVHEAQKSEVFSVYCLFEYPTKAKETLGSSDFSRLNGYSGKWNYHDYDATDLIGQLELNLLNIKTDQPCTTI